MDRKEGVKNNDVTGCSGIVKNSEAFIDRSRVRILLCDNNSKSSQEAFELLCNCSYQDQSRVTILLCDNNSKSCEEAFELWCNCSYHVTSVKSARQVIDALNAEGPDIDLILSEVDLPMAKGMKMLKYIMRDHDLRRIPVIMMSAQDEVSIVVKCLRLGAADYLVKPLRTNELLNLWTHMWRRRRMLGLSEKNIMNYQFDQVASDPSDGNTNSTTLFSDDTDEKSRKTANTEICMPVPQEEEANFMQRFVVPDDPVSTAMALYAAFEPPHMQWLDCRSDVPGISDRRTESSNAYKPPPPRGRLLTSAPKKSELRIGESSAFFTYVKSSIIPKSSTQGIVQAFESAQPDSNTQVRLNTWAVQVANDTQVCENMEARENQYLGDEFPPSSTVPESHSKDESSTPPVMMDFPQQKNSDAGNCPQMQFNPTNKSPSQVSNTHSQNAYPYFIPGLMNHMMMPQYSHLPQCPPPHIPNMPPFPYYPMGLCLQPGQIPTPHHQWPSYGTSSPATDAKVIKVDRREAALMKFRQKRKERCFDKKIRYVNRKRLAERRPRVRGQFVRKMNGIVVDLNGTPGSVDVDEGEDEEENVVMEISPVDDA